MRWLVAIVIWCWGAFLLAPPEAKALTNGDVAVVFFTADGDDALSFVALTNIPASTLIYFSDLGWTNSNRKYSSGEGKVRWSHSSEVTPGTVVVITNLAAGTVTATLGTGVREGSFNMGGTDSLLVSTSNSVAGIWHLFGTKWTTAWGSGTGTAYCERPDELTNAAMHFTTADNFRYNRTLTNGTKAELLAAITNTANWTVGGSGSPLTNLPFTVNNPSPPCNPTGSLTFVQQIAHYTKFTSGGDIFNVDSARMGMWANSGVEQVVAWRNFRTDGTGGGELRELQPGDRFRITINGPNPNGRVGVSINDGAATSTWNDRTNNTRGFIQVQGGGANDYFVTHNGGTPSWSGIRPNSTDQTIVFDILSSHEFTANIEGQTPKYDLAMLNSPGVNDRIDGFSLFLNDDAGDIHWKQATVVTNLGYVEFGADNGTRDIVGKVTDSTDPACTNTTAPNLLRKTGTGTVTLQNTANTYTKGTRVEAGTLAVFNDGSLGTAPGSAIATNIDIYSTATLRATNSFTLNANRGITLGNINGPSIEVDSGKTLTYSGVLGGNAEWNKKGAGTLALTGTSSTNNGKVTIQGGTLQIAGDGSLGAVPASAAEKINIWSTGTLEANATISLNANRRIELGTIAGPKVSVTAGNTLTYGGQISGSANWSKEGTGTLTLTGGISTASGTLIVNAGTVLFLGTNTSQGVGVGSAGFLYGNGSVGALTITGQVSAGSASNTVGNLRSSSLNLQSNGRLQVNFSAMTGAAGTDWDVLTVGGGSGTYTVNAVDGSDFVIALKGSPSFNNALGYTNILIDAGTASSFAANKFTINTSEFTPDLAGGTFSVDATGGDLRLVFTPAVVAEPDIVVLGTNGAAIANGDVSPAAADGTDFGKVYVLGAAAVTNTFAITNAGTATLTLSSISTNSAMGAAGDFIVIAWPTTIPVGGKSNLVVAFNPAAIGVRTAVVSIANNDTAKNPYTFVVAGEGTGSFSTITFQGFEGSNADSWTYTRQAGGGDIYVDGGTNAGGAYALTFRGSVSLNADPYVEFSGIDLAGYGAVTLRVAFAVAGADSGDDLELDFSYDGGANWGGPGSVTLVAGASNTNLGFTGIGATTVAANPWYVALPATAQQVRVRVRFDESANDNSFDRYFIDNVELTGIGVMPTVSFGDVFYTTTETNGTITVPVSISSSSAATVQVALAGSATPGGTDYSVNTTNIVFTAGGATTSNLVFTLVNDSVSEGQEEIGLRLVAARGARVSGPAASTILVQDDDVITIMAANLTSGTNLVDGTYWYTESAQRIFRRLRPDVVAIQEWKFTNASARAFVDSVFGTNYHFYIEPESDGNPIPNGVISRWPITVSNEWTDAFVGSRDHVQVTIDIPGNRNLHVVSTHFKAGSGEAATRENQARALTNYIATAAFPTNDYVVIAGDLNLTSRTEATFGIITSMVTDVRQPADRDGEINTNLGRNNPYDFVLPNHVLNADHITINVAGVAFADGVIFDTSQFNDHLLPSLVQDAYDSNRTHLAVMKAFTISTSAAPPTVTTTIASATNTTTATAGGNVTDDGGATVTNRGVVWSLSATPTVPGAQTTNGTGTGSFSSTLTNLTPGATYYYRAFAQNPAGTSYGAEYQLTALCWSGAVTGLVVTATNELNFTAAWSSFAGATGYALDVSTNSSFGGAGGGGSTYTNTWEGASKASYASGTVAIAGITWWLHDALIGTSASDRKNGSNSARVQNSGTLGMQTSTNMGLSSITFLYAKYGTDANTDGRVEYSTDGWSTWSTAGTFTATSTTLTEFEATNLNVNGSVAVRVIKTSGGSARYNIDDIRLYPNGSSPNFIDGYSNRVVATTSASVTGLTGGVTYYFRVRATNDFCVTPDSATGSVTTTLFVPDVAVLGTNLAAITISNTSPVTANGTDFGAVGVNLSNRVHTFTITNSGNAALGVGNVTTSGTHAADFIVLTQPSASIAAGGSSTFQVRFDPSAAGQRDATLTFTNTVNGKSPFPFAVRGAGVQAGIGRGPATTSVTVMVGTTPAAASFGVTNVGLGRLDYTIATNASWLSVSPVSANLNEGAGQAHTITFNVTGLSAGTSNATVTIADAGASNSPQTVAVTLILTNIPDASAVTGWADGREMVRLGWTRPAGLDVMIVHRSTNAPATPVQGQSYNVGDTFGGNGSRVIYKGSGANFEHVIIPGQTNHYAFYAINNHHYAPGVATNLATTAYPAGEIVDVFAYTNVGTLATTGHGGGGNGWTNSWTGDAGSFNIVSGSFSSISSYPTSAANKVRINSGDVDGTSKAARRHFNAYTTGKVYAAYMLNYQYNGVNKYAGMSFMDGTTEKLFFGEGYNGDQRLAVGGNTTTSNMLAGFGNDYLVVGMYDFAADTGYVAAYKIGTDSVPSSEPTTWHGSHFDNTITRIDGIHLAAGAGSGNGTPGDTYFDEVRVATSWELLLANYAQPEIAVLGTNRVVLTGGNTPDAGNGTDFGAALVAGGQVDRTLFITNSGEGVLNISGVTTSGAHAADFVVVSWPTKVSPNAVSNLVLRFDPVAAGARTGTIEVASDDADESTYTFTVTGTGQVPPTVTTTIASATNLTTATAGGNVTGDGFAAVTNRGVVWSLSAAPTVPGAQTTNGTGTGSFSSTLTNLVSGATYYYRAFAQNSAGTSYGTEYTLVTPCFSGVVTGLYASATNELNFTATWSNVVGASGYALDVSTEPGFGEGAGGNYGVEAFTNVGGGSSSSYLTRQWTNNGVAWTGYLARTDQTIDGAALTLQNANGSYLVSQVITGGVNELRVTHQLKFTGADSFDIFVNSIKVATNITYSSSIQTAVVQNIGVTGDFTIMITNYSGGRVALDNLTWSNSGSVASYVPGYSNRTVSGTSVSVTGLTGDVSYYFRVRATNDYCATGNSATATVTTIAGVPAAPGGVIASDGTSLTEVSVIWSNVASEQGYAIWRHTANVFGSASQIGSAAVNVTNFSDTTATPGQLYYYWVTASNAVGSSAAGTSDSGYRQLAQVTGVAATDLDDTNNTQIVVTWSDVTGETGYGIWRNTVDASNTATYVGGAAANATGFADTSAGSYTTYYYWVRATNNTSASQGAWSASDAGYAGVREPRHLGAAAASISTVSLTFTQNVENSQIIIVYDLDGTFSAPSGAAPAVGAAFAGGTVVYKGTVSPQTHTGLAACTPYFYSIWSYDGTLYSATSLTASATTEAPAAPTGLYVNPTNANNFTLNWSPSTGASGYRVDVSTNSVFGSLGTIRAQGFEAAVDDTWGFVTAGSVTTSTTRKRTGTYSLRLDGSGNPSVTFDPVVLSGTSASTVTVAFSASGVDGDEDLFLSVCTYVGGVLSSNTIKLVDGLSNLDVAFNATNASTVATNPYSVAVSAAATQVYLVVYATGLESGEYYYIDDLSLTGELGSFVSGYGGRSVAGTSVSVTGLLQNTLYYYRVRAEGALGCSGPNSLTGSVTTISAPIIGLSTNTLNFGTVPVGVSSNLTLVVTNSGFANVVVSAINLSGTCTNPYTVTPSAFTVSPGTASNVVVTFTPAVTGACSMTLTVNNNTPGDTAPTVSVTGTGYDPSSILAPTGVTAAADGAEMVVLGWTKVGGTPNVVVLWNSNAITATALTAGQPYNAGDSGPDGTLVAYHGSAAGGVEIVVGQKSTNYFRLFGGSGTLYSTNYIDPAGLPVETLKYETGEIIDQFAYTNNKTLAENNLATGQGWSGGWTGDTNKYTVIDTNLLHGATGFPDPYANKLFWQDTSTFSADDARVTRMLGSARGGRIFIAFMMNYQYDGTEKYVGLSLMSGTNAATEEIFFGKLYGSIKAAGIEDPGAPSTTTASYDLEPGHGNDYMIVGELNPAQKTARMWAFYQGGGAIPQEYTNATPVAVYSNSSLSVSAITGIRLSAGSSGTANKELGHVYFDEVRVGGTWDEVLNFNFPEVYDYQVGTRVGGTNYVTDGALVEAGKTYDVSYTLYHRSGITNAQFTILDDVTGTGLYPTNVNLQFGANLAAGRQRYTNAVTNRLDFGDIELGTYTSRVFMTANSGRATNSIIVAETGGAGDLFFGEFGEGNNWDKYVEIYNGTGGAIDLSQYLLASQTTPGDKYVKWANWSRLSAATFWLDHGETIVLLNGGLNGGVAGSDTVDASMTNAMIAANRSYLFTSNNVLNVSGDDPVALFRVSDTNNWVDVCGIGPSVARYIMRRVEDSDVPRSYPLQVDTNQWDYREWDGDRPTGYTNFLATAGVYDRNVGLGGFITFQVVDDDTNAPMAGAMSMLLAGVPVTNTLTAPLLLAGWNFNDTTNLRATSHGVGVMTDNLYTTNSSSGASINLVDGDVAGNDLTMLGGTNTGRYIQFAVNMQYYQDLVVTFAAQRSAAGYNSNTISYSINGGAFVNVETNWNPDTSTTLKTVDLSSVSAVDNATNVVLRITLGGGSGGNNRYDNFQFRAQRLVYGFTDGLLARVHSTNALHLGFRAYDTHSGVQRGTANDGVNMSVSLPGVITNNSSLYQSSFSSASTTGSAATSVWAFTSFSYGQIGSLYGTGSNYVLISATMADADHDRNNDRLWVSNQVYGVLHVTDDDPEPPLSVNVNLPGAAAAPFVLTTNGTAPSDAIRGFISRRTGSGSNVVTSVTDHELANAGALNLQFYFGARDQHGLVQRGNAGTTNTVMNFSLGSVVSGNYADYNAGLSSAQATTNTITTNAWSFSGAFAAGDVITALVTGGQQVVTVTIPDDDDDRPDDRGVARGRQVGFLNVVDDDVKGPIIGSITPDKVYGSNAVLYTSFETSQGWPVGSLSSAALWTNVTSQGAWLGNGVTYGTLNPKVSGTRRIGLLTNSIASPWFQLPPVNDPGSLILFAGRFSGNDVTLRVERASGGSWLSVGSVVVTNVEPEFEAFSVDINVSGVTTLRVAHAGGPQVYIDDLSVLPQSVWLSTNNLSLAWSEAVDDFSSVDEYRVVAPAVGATRPVATNDGSYVSPAVTSQTFNITGQQGIITGFVFAVDNDNDRVGDRAIGNLATVVVRIDTNPPPAVTNFVGSKDPGDVDDSTSQIKLTWNSRGTAAEAAGWRQSDNAPLSPFVSYRIYYAENQDRDLTYADTYLDKDSDYTDLGDYATAEVTLNDLVPGYTYSIAMAGVDEAGNVGPMSERVTITLDIFGITHAFANEASQTVIQWEGRDDGLYDVIYADSTGYTAQVDGLWKLARTVVGTQFVDEGGADVGSNVERVAPRALTPKWMRFYRVAPVNAWVPTATRAGAASEEIVVAHQVPLMQSNNFIGVSMSPMVDTVADFLGTNRLPGAATTMSESPRINFYTASTNGNADDNTLWLSRINGTNRWLNQLSAPAGSDPLPYPYQGFSLYVPVATNLLMVGRVPWTNNADMVKIEGQKYNVLSLNLPRPTKVSELELRNLLTWGENIGSADEIRIMQKGTAPWGSPRARMYVWTNGLFYYPGASRQLAENFVIDADDAIIVYAKATPENVTNEVDWSATELAFYPVPGVQITNSFPAAPTVRALTSYVVDNTNGLLRGSVNPNNLETEFWFQYGTTTNYGSSTAKLVLPATNVPVVVSSNIYNLVPGATYYFRVMASNALGISRGGQGSITVGSGPDNMAYIPAGTYTMGGNTNVFAEPAADELPQHNLSIGAFYMDRYEVTAQLWSNVYAWAVTNGYGFSTDGTGKGSSHPITSISWYDAVKWCNARSEMEGKPLVYYTSAGMTNAYRTGDLDIQSGWVNWTNRGYRLPTEAEWEKAARGGVADARFPWSGYTNRVSHGKANFSNDGAEAYAFGTTGQHPSYSAGADPDTSPVGSFGANGYGLYDMAGNADEFCWDWYSSSYYSSSPGTDPRGPVSGSLRVVRGGGYGDWAEALRVSARESGLGNSNLQRGFRTVLTP